ncbi:MAG TPA: helix-turn-helix transcriptional regulator [Conexibacter sp.]|nr:helix-turn-helix transcriptional regulator [Conexibacter sp.]
MGPPTNVVDLGRAVRAVRRDLDLSQEALARRAGLHPNQVGRLERGTNVRAGTLLAVVEGLGVGLAELGRAYDARR